MALDHKNVNEQNSSELQNAISDFLNITVKQHRNLIKIDLNHKIKTNFLDRKYILKVSPIDFYRNYHFKVSELIRYIRKQGFTSKQILTYLKLANIDKLQEKLAVRYVNLAEKLLKESDFIVTKDLFNNLTIKLSYTSSKKGGLEIKKIV